MTHLRMAVAAIAAVMMVSATAPAKDEWKTVTLGGDPNFTISIPAAVTDYNGGKDPDVLMFFSVAAGMHGDLECMAHRSDYPLGVTQTAFAAALATARRETFCQQDGATISNVSIGGSRSFDVNGFQGAACTASFTDSREKMPGLVRSQMIVATPSKATFLTCTSNDEDQEVAEYEWASLWGAKVGHMQDSLRVPK